MKKMEGCGNERCMWKQRIHIILVDLCFALSVPVTPNQLQYNGAAYKVVGQFS